MTRSSSCYSESAHRQDMSHLGAPLPLGRRPAGTGPSVEALGVDADIGAASHLAKRLPPGRSVKAIHFTEHALTRPQQEGLAVSDKRTHTADPVRHAHRRISGQVSDANRGPVCRHPKSAVNEEGSDWGNSGMATAGHRGQGEVDRCLEVLDDGQSGWRTGGYLEGLSQEWARMPSALIEQSLQSVQLFCRFQH